MNTMPSVLSAGLLMGALLMSCTDKQPLVSSATSASAAPSPVPSSKVAVIVTVTDARPINDIVADLKKQGLEVDNVMERVGVVAGHVAASAMPNLKAVTGVKAVERDQPVSAQ